MIYIAIGANLPSKLGHPQHAVAASITALSRHGISPVKISRFYQTPPMMGPMTSPMATRTDTGKDTAQQPPYVNAVIGVKTYHSPQVLLARLHDIEADFGRERREKWGARALDLDLLDYHGRKAVYKPVLPHPGIQDRAFVLVPLRDVAPRWRHPVSGKSLDVLLSAFSDGDLARMSILPKTD